MSAEHAKALFVQRYTALGVDQELQYLSAVGQYLMLEARATYEAGTHEVLNPSRLRLVSEAMGRLFDRIRRLGSSDPRPPNDTYWGVLIDNFEMLGRGPEHLSAIMDRTPL